MNQRQLAYFLEVYKHRSITAAAQSLFISPQGLSKTILALEDELGIKLFTRSKNQMIPTREAINLTSHAKAILSEYELILNKEFISHTTKKTLQILGSYDVFQYFPASFFYEFQNLYPEISLNLVELPELVLLEQLDENEADLALAPGPLDANTYDLDYLFTNHFVLVMNEAHPLASKEVITFEDLAEQPLVIKGKNLPISNLQTNYFLSNGVEPNVILEVTDYHVIHQIAKDNYAVGMTLDYLAEHDTTNGIVARPFAEAAFVKSMYLVQRKNIRPSNETGIFREYLLNWLKTSKIH